ncbi:MAG: phytanoyl-CoA dioxygenase family protein [Gammaproteobacteria bacterium]|nr:phytanoyl-CoA dioxygenase family protein [Gammaproteobacteria bacterium]
MEIENWESAGALPLLYGELKQLGLESNVAELEAFGFTVVPPDKVGPPEFHLEVKEAVERVVADRFGSLDTHIDRWDNVNDQLRFLIWEDPIFEKVTYNPAGLGLVQYLLGTNCILSLVNAWVKGPGERRTGIHGDYLDPTRDALPPININANVHLMLTDYSKDDGAISFLPGSHRWRRQATPPESKYWADKAHAVEAQAGSMVIWGNHTWHGSYPKTTPGVRMTLQCEYMRPRFQPQEPFRETVTQEALDRNPVRFAGLVDVYAPFPFGKNDRIMDERQLDAPPGTGHDQPAEKYCSLFDTEPAKGRVTLRPQYDYFAHDGLMAWERYAAYGERVRSKREAAAGNR